MVIVHKEKKKHMQVNRSNDVDLFAQRLNETISWCIAKDWTKGKLDKETRTPLLKPPDIASDAQEILKTKPAQSELAKQFALDGKSIDLQWQLNVENLSQMRLSLFGTQNVILRHFYLH